MSDSSQSQQSWWRLGIRLSVVLIFAFVGASIASQAAFQETPPQPLSESQQFWQQDTIATITKSTSSEEVTPKKPTPGLPSAVVKTSASGYLISDLESGQILAAKNAEQKQPIASLTKLMTAVVAHETIGDSTKISITDNAVSTYGSSGGLSAGITLPLSTLYYPLLLSSSNDAAAAIAEHVGTGRFLNLMNRKALAIEMNNTRFSDASGLSADNTSTPTDLGRLARYIYNHNHFIFNITAAAQQSVGANQPGPQRYSNKNPVHTEPGFVGGKNGYTDVAQQTSLSVFEVTKNSQTRPVVIIVLNSNSAVTDTQKLLSWIKNK